jgi:hypothetical protein
LINFLRDEYINNNQHQPNNREMMKEMSERWGLKVEQKMLFDLFPGTPSKQAGRIAGLPENGKEAKDKGKGNGKRNRPARPVSSLYLSLFQFSLSKGVPGTRVLCTVRAVIG